MSDKRIAIIAGHFGSGKTEFSVNYALRCARQGEKTCLVDLDIINPYFRSREKKQVLQQHGITVLGSSTNNDTMGLPTLTAGIRGALEDPTQKCIVDLGGNPEGARILAGYRKNILGNPYELFLVVNTNRPETSTESGILQMLADIQRASGLYATAFVHNTHFLKETTADDILRGRPCLQNVSKKTGIPIRYEAGLKTVLQELPAMEGTQNFPIDLHMRESWMT